MKTYLTAAVLAIFTQLASCQEIPSRSYKITTEIVDETGKPVQDAVVQSSKHELIPNSPIPQSRSVRVDALTNQNGIAEINLISVQAPGGVAIAKDGYYLTTALANWEHPDGFEGAWSAQIKSIIKPIKNPIPMCASSMTGDRVIILPEMNKNYGYDLQLADLVEPNGKGKRSDFLIRIEGEYKNAKQARLTAVIHFIDRDDGVIEFLTTDREKGSILLGDYEAPNQGYKNELNINFDSSDIKANYSRTQDGNYYFRARTTRDASGDIIQSNYGKIHGNFVLWAIPVDQGGVAQISWIASYFNPTPNDRNVEFDTKRNLIPDGNVHRP